MVHEAWKTLSDKEQRAAYDLERCRRKMQINDRSLADNVNFSDFEVLEENEDGDMLYAKPCRKGGLLHDRRKRDGEDRHWKRWNIGAL